MCLVRYSQRTCHGNPTALSSLAAPGLPACLSAGPGSCAVAAVTVCLLATPPALCPSELCQQRISPSAAWETPPCWRVSSTAAAIMASRPSFQMPPAAAMHVPAPKTRAASAGEAPRWRAGLMWRVVASIIASMQPAADMRQYCQDWAAARCRQLARCVTPLVTPPGCTAAFCPPPFLQDVLPTQKDLHTVWLWWRE